MTEAPAFAEELAKVNEEACVVIEGFDEVAEPAEEREEDEEG
jgi:hypothetical protein